MGLDITAKIKTKAFVNAELEYNKLWEKVQSGEMTEDEYYKNYPEDTIVHRNINASEYGIRNFYGLKRYFIDNLGKPESNVFQLDKMEIFSTLYMAEEYEIPYLEEHNYYGKCNELARICHNALKYCDFNTEIVEFFFCE